MKTLPIYGQAPKREPGQRPLWTSLEDLAGAAPPPGGVLTPPSAPAEVEVLSATGNIH